MKIYITHLLQISNFSSPFRWFEIKNFLRRPTMVTDNISNFVPPPRIFFISTGLIITFEETFLENFISRWSFIHKYDDS